MSMNFVKASRPFTMSLSFLSLCLPCLKYSIAKLTSSSATRSPPANLAYSS